jgi:hypothetical protein
VDNPDNRYKRIEESLRFLDQGLTYDQKRRALLATTIVNQPEMDVFTKVEGERLQESHKFQTIVRKHNIQVRETLLA